MADATTITINNKTYPLDALSDVAKTHLNNLRIADQELARLKNQIALVETARNLFARGIAQNVPADEHLVQTAAEGIEG